MSRSSRLSWLCALGLINACASSPEPGASIDNLRATPGKGELYAAGSGASPAAAGSGIPAAANGGAQPAAAGNGNTSAANGGAQAGAGPAAGSGGAGNTALDPTLCLDGFPRGTAAHSSTRRIAVEKPSPEGVTVCPDGEVYIACDLSGEVWHVPLDGSPQELWATLGDRRPAGLTCDERGRLFVTTYAAKSGSADLSLGPTLITGKGATPSELPQPEAAAKYAGLNGIVAVPGLGIYVSDTNNNYIVLLRETESGVWSAHVVASDVSLANGLAYSKQQQMLYVNASGSWELLQFRIAADGTLSDRKSLDVPFMLFMDGVAVDEHGDLYVADWLGGAVVAVASGRAVMQVANPASLAFRGGTLLATDYKLTDPDTEGGLFAADLGVCGGSN